MKTKIIIFFFFSSMCVINSFAQTYNFPMSGKSLDNVTSSFGPRSVLGGDFCFLHYTNNSFVETIFYHMEISFFGTKIEISPWGLR